MPISVTCDRSIPVPDSMTPPQKSDDPPPSRKTSKTSGGIFGLQLEVTHMLLEAEKRRLAVLQRELQSSPCDQYSGWGGSCPGSAVCSDTSSTSSNGSYKGKEPYKEELLHTILHSQQQYDQLEQEYKQYAVSALISTGCKFLGKNLSQPVYGLRQIVKPRPTIFGTVTSDQDPTEHGSRKTFPQTPRSQQGITNNGLFVDRTPYMEESIRDRSDHALVYRHNNLVSGPIEALVQHLVPTEEYYPEHTYLFAFLLTSRLFIKPHELLGQVFELCALHRDFNELHISRGPHSKLGPNIIQLLGEWTETFPYDFRDERMKNHLKSLTQFCLRLDPHLDKEVSQLLQKLLHTLENLEKHEELLRRMQPGVRMINQQVTNEIMSVCPDPVILAQQLTRIELERLSFIGPEEFVQTFAKESQTLETSFKDIKQTKNLESYISWFNHLSYFVATEVIIQLKKKHRVRVIEFFIEVARECFNIGNFNSLMAIISGLNLSPITRLKKTWHRVATRKLHILEQQMAPNSNFTSYRATLAAAMWRSQGAQDDRRRIIVPLFSLLVKDLYFLNEGCANRLPNGHVNFEKFWQLAKQVSEFITWQRVSCPFELDEAINKYLNTNPIFKDDAVLTMASFECEAPENTLEKERQKVLNKKFGKENWALNTTMKNYKKENRTNDLQL